MFLVRLLRYLKGYVRFTITGGFIERFLNLCSRGGVPLWDLEHTQEGMISSTTVKHYPGLRGYARRTGVRLRVKERHGFPFLLRRYRKRWGIFVGLLAFFIFLGAMSNFIWQIQVVGNETLTEEEIVAQLEELGVTIGANRHKIDTRWVERNMLLRLEELSWIGVNLTGSTAEIEVKERVMPPEKIDDEKQPTNVIAGESGQIKYMEVYDGKAVVSVGDTVVKGDIIVSGVLEDSKGKTTFKHARAKVMAQVPASLSVEVPLNQTIYEPSGKMPVERKLCLFGLEVPLSLPAKTGEFYNRYESVKNFSVLGRKLPVSLKSIGYEQLEKVEIVYTEDQALAEAQNQLLALEAQSFADATVVTKNPVAFVEQDTLLMKAEYIVEKDIAVVQEILIKE